MKVKVIVDDEYLRETCEIYKGDVIEVYKKLDSVKKLKGYITQDKKNSRLWIFLRINEVEIQL